MWVTGRVSMKFRHWLVRILITAVVLSVYLAVVWMGLTEERRRSLEINGPPLSVDDYVSISVGVTSVDTVQGLLHGRIAVIPAGRFAKDRVTPAGDLKLLINSVTGKQTVVFPAGERIYPMDFTSLLTGNQNRYPFDRYVSDIGLLVTAPARKRAVAEVPTADQLDPSATPLVVGSSDLAKSETVTIRESLSASIPGLKFEGNVGPVGESKLMNASIRIRRANSVIGVSVVVMTVMFLLSISIMSMVLQAIATHGEINLMPLSLCVALIFGLPALRNTQPGVPGVGVIGDYMSFIWAEFIVASSAVTLAWIWIVRSAKARKLN
jgi:hypothetical protein